MNYYVTRASRIDIEIGLSQTSAKIVKLLLMTI
jgi:hypothetical protein